MPKFNNKQKILHIDDNESNRYLIKHILSNEGYELLEAANAHDGLKSALNFPDLILLDIRLPDMNGFEVCRQIKSNPQTSSIPVLQTSAVYISNENKVEGLDSGADGYLTQPIDAHILVATVKSLLRMHEAERKAQIAMAGRQEMLAIVSHDLRTPLSSIILLVKILEKSLKQGNSVIDLPAKLERIVKSCNTMDRLIQDLLDVTSLEGGKFNITKTTFSLKELITELFIGLEDIARHEEITLIQNVDEKIILFADRNRIMQAIGNLISNSLKFTPKQGHIIFEVKESENYIIISVEDNGIGISFENIENIFNRYWQGRTNPKKGVGLGMTIVKGIVDAHNGEIEVESEIEKGTKVIISLPKNCSENNQIYH